MGPYDPRTIVTFMRNGKNCRKMEVPGWLPNGSWGKKIVNVCEGQQQQAAPRNVTKKVGGTITNTFNRDGKICTRTETTGPLPNGKWGTQKKTVCKAPPRVGSIRKFVNRVRAAPRVQQPLQQAPPPMPGMPANQQPQQPYNQPQIYNNQQPPAFMQQPLQQAPPPSPGMPAPPVRTVADNSAPWNVQFQQNPHWSTTDEIEE